MAAPTIWQAAGMPSHSSASWRALAACAGHALEVLASVTHLLPPGAESALPGACGAQTRLPAWPQGGTLSPETTSGVAAQQQAHRLQAFPSTGPCTLYPIPYTLMLQGDTWQRQAHRLRGSLVDEGHAVRLAEGGQRVGCHLQAPRPEGRVGQQQHLGAGHRLRAAGHSALPEPCLGRILGEAARGHWPPACCSQRRLDHTRQARTGRLHVQQEPSWAAAQRTGSTAEGCAPCRCGPAGSTACRARPLAGRGGRPPPGPPCCCGRPAPSASAD